MSQPVTPHICDPEVSMHTHTGNLCLLKRAQSKDPASSRHIQYPALGFYYLSIKETKGLWDNEQLFAQVRENA